MKIDRIIKNLTGALNASDNGDNNNNNNNGHNQDNKEHERQNYLESKAQYEKHNKNYYISNAKNMKGEHAAYQGEQCSAKGCVIECPYWPAVGYETDDGLITYDDWNFEPEFYGVDNALETRRKVAAYTPEQYAKYTEMLKLSHEYTEDTKAAIAAGKRMYASSGFYGSSDDPTNDPLAVPYRWKFNGDIYDV